MSPGYSHFMEKELIDSSKQETHDGVRVFFMLPLNDFFVFLTSWNLSRKTGGSNLECFNSLVILSNLRPIIALCNFAGALPSQMLLSACAKNYFLPTPGNHIVVVQIPVH